MADPVMVQVITNFIEDSEDRLSDGYCYYGGTVAVEDLATKIVNWFERRQEIIEKAQRATKEFAKDREKPEYTYSEKPEYTHSKYRVF